MLGPRIPTPLDQLGARPFSFYPPIAGTEHNEWTLQGLSVEEIHVSNRKTRQSLRLPRRLVSGVSSIEEPVVIVGLVKDLEYREGAVVPLVRRVIEMPRAVNDIPWRAPDAPLPGHRAPVVGIRLSAEPAARHGRRWMAGAAAVVLACVVGSVVYREWPLGPRARFFSRPSRAVLNFQSSDTYQTVVSRLGRPFEQRILRNTDGDLDFYLLRYPERGFTLVLLGASRDEARYAGALGRSGRLIHSVHLPDGKDSAAALAGIPH